MLDAAEGGARGACGAGANSGASAFGVNAWAKGCKGAGEEGVSESVGAAANGASGDGPLICGCIGCVLMKEVMGCIGGATGGADAIVCTGGEGSRACAGAAASLPNTSLDDMLTFTSRLPCAITVRKVASVPSMIVPRSIVTVPEASCGCTLEAGSFEVIQAGRKVASKPSSCGECPRSAAASETSIISSAGGGGAEGTMPAGGITRIVRAAGPAGAWAGAGCVNRIIDC